MRIQPQIIDTITKHIGRYPHVEKVVLFGSRARGDEEDRSDIDIAVVGSEITRSEWLEMREYVEEKARTLLSIELVRLDDASEKLKEIVQGEGVVLYERH